MNRLLTGLYVVILLLPSWTALAAHIEPPKQIVGTLNCKVLPNSGINLLIHSTKEIRCQFTSGDNRSVEYYKGETGIRLGIDIRFSKGTDIIYSVLSNTFKQGEHQLAGKYSGASGSATFGLTAGDSSSVEKDDKSIFLQPIKVDGSGAGAAGGLSYLYLEADSAR